MIPEKQRRLGKLPPLYRFILNPYKDVRFTRCPGCNQKTRQRKRPLYIHIDPINPIILGKTCRYCPDCDLLIAHQDEIEKNLAQLFSQTYPDLIGNEYLIIGTVERKVWRQGMTNEMSTHDMLEHLRDFKEVLTVEVRRAGWYSDDDDA